ncbi:MAG: GNAT family N-acetyltransferase [Tetrasphaera sp.]
MPAGWSGMPRPASAVTPPSTPTCSAVESAPGWPSKCSAGRANSEPRSSECRCTRAHPGIGCWRSWAITSAGPPGSCSYPRGHKSPTAPCRRGMPCAPPGTRSRSGARSMTLWKTPSVNGRTGSASRSRTSRPASCGGRGSPRGTCGWSPRRTDRSPQRPSSWSSEEPKPEAYVSRLATRADQRHRGLAQALLVDAFAVAREHGAVVCGLSTDSRTGALGLYEKVGMRVVDTWVNRAITL